jgi:transcriptional regulator with XRE-family HTH domain
MNHIRFIVNTFMRINTTVKIAVIVRALRNAFGMSQDDLATLAKCSRPTINRIESMDKTSPRSNTVDDLYQVFRDKGVEVQISDEEVTIKFTKTALLDLSPKEELIQEPQLPNPPKE